MPFGKRFQISTSFISYILENISICNLGTISITYLYPDYFNYTQEIFTCYISKIPSLGLKRMLYKTSLQTTQNIAFNKLLFKH